MLAKRNMLSKGAVEAMYAKRRQRAYQDAEEVFQAIDSSLKLTPITDQALAQARMWKHIKPASRQIDWDWDEEYPKFQRRPERMEVAIWHDVTLLCGVSLGKVSKRHITATIHLLEGGPTLPPSLKGRVAKIVTIFLQAYALRCGCSTLVVDTPHPLLVEFYKELGFRHEVLENNVVVRLTQKVTEALPFDPLI